MAVTRLPWWSDLGYSCPVSPAWYLLSGFLLYSAVQPSLSTPRQTCLITALVASTALAFKTDGFRYDTRVLFLDNFLCYFIHLTGLLESLGRLDPYAEETKDKVEMWSKKMVSALDLS